VPPVTTTVPPSTLPRRGQPVDNPNRGRKVTQPKNLVVTWDLRTSTPAPVASWGIETVPDRYTLTCENLGRPAGTTTIEFERSSVTVSPTGRHSTTLLLTPSTAMRCRLTSHIGLERSIPSNTAVVPALPRKPVTTTTIAGPTTTTTVVPPTSSTVPAAPAVVTTTTTKPTTTTAKPTTTTTKPTAKPTATTAKPTTTTKPTPGNGNTPPNTSRPVPTATTTILGSNSTGETTPSTPTAPAG